VPSEHTHDKAIASHSFVHVGLREAANLIAAIILVNDADVYLLHMLELVRSREDIDDKEHVSAPRLVFPELTKAAYLNPFVIFDMCRLPMSCVAIRVLDEAEANTLASEVIALVENDALPGSLDLFSLVIVEVDAINHCTITGELDTRSIYVSC
jgi:hypothetical protein